MVKMIKKNWSEMDFEEKKEQVTRLIQKGGSFKKVALILKATTGQVSGFVNLHLGSVKGIRDGTLERNTGGQERMQKPVRVKARTAKANTPAKQDQKKKEVKSIEERSAEISTIGVTLAELDKGQCKYIIDGGLYCGQPSDCRSKSYCAGHAGLVYKRRRSKL